MPSSPILMVIAVIFMIIIFIGGGFFCLYQYKLYQLTKFSERWRPWKGTTIGILGLEIGIVYAAANLLTGIFLTYPELISIDFIYLPLFILVYALLIISGCGIWWAAIGLKRYWMEVHKIAVKAASS